jgi:hypothetical protein
LGIVDYDSETSYLTIEPAKATVEGIFKLYIEATAVGDVKAYKKLQVEFYESVNLEPVFAITGTELTKIEVQVKEDDQTAGKSKVIKVASPKATDPEGDGITFEFVGAGELPFLSFTSSADAFEAAIDESQVTAEHEGEHEIIVKLADGEERSFSTAYFLKVEVKFEATKVVEAEAAAEEKAGDGD